MKKKILFGIGIMALWLFPFKNYAQAPTLGTAANFVIFSSNGAVSNNGISQITGNVGTNGGSSTTFGNVNGGMHDGDSVSIQCAADVLTAYNQLNALVATLSHAPALGNGDTLTAGIYAISAASTINGVLYLNAENNANAIFIFKIQGTLATAAGTKIKLINGAQACKVYWKVEGAVSMAAGTTMRGTIIANNAAISMSTGDTLEGRILSTTGAVSVDGVMAYTPIGCGSPVLNGPTAPSLGSAGCYAIFSGVGAVTNTGVTTITGDVGSNNGLTTGYDTLLVTGVVHPSPDTSTAQCSADLLVAYNYVNALPYDIRLLYPAQFGRNLVLTPHTYRLQGAVTFTDTLYLNAMGNANAVFVIQINGALSTSTYSKVILTNGAQAKNVYWKVEGAVSLNNYSVFNGTIICNNAALGAINTGVVLNGRALTTAGALSTAAITATIPEVCSINTPTIVSEPSNQVVCSGNPATFTVVASGLGLSYKWRKGTALLNNGGNITGAQTATLTINPAVAADTATDYNVIVSGSVGAADTSNNASLAVNMTPVITSQPVNRMACPGSAVSFFVTASGTDITYQWKKGTTSLTNVGNTSGVFTNMLTISPMLIPDTASNYNVVVSGTCTPAVTSPNVSLSLCDPTGIEMAATKKQLANIYPNPFSSSIEIEMHDVSKMSNCEWKVYNAFGVEVMNKKIAERITKVETGQLPSGIYFYKIMNNQKTIQSGRLISE